MYRWRDVYAAIEVRKFDVYEIKLFISDMKRTGLNAIVVMPLPLELPKLANFVIWYSLDISLLSIERSLPTYRIGSYSSSCALLD